MRPRLTLALAGLMLLTTFASTAEAQLGRRRRRALEAAAAAKAYAESQQRQAETVQATVEVAPRSEAQVEEARRFAAAERTVARRLRRMRWTHPSRRVRQQAAAVLANPEMLGALTEQVRAKALEGADPNQAIGDEIIKVLQWLVDNREEIIELIQMIIALFGGLGDAAPAHLDVVLHVPDVQAPVVRVFNPRRAAA